MHIVPKYKTIYQFNIPAEDTKKLMMSVINTDKNTPHNPGYLGQFSGNDFELIERAHPIFEFKLGTRPYGVLIKGQVTEKEEKSEVVLEYLPHTSVKYIPWFLLAFWVITLVGFSTSNKASFVEYFLGDTIILLLIYFMTEGGLYFSINLTRKKFDALMNKLRQD